MNSNYFYKYLMACMSILTGFTIFWTLIYTKAVLMPLVFAVFYFFASLPLMNFLETKLKVPKSLSSWLTTLFTGAFAITLIFQLSLSFRSLFLELNTYRDSFLGFMDKLGELAQKFGVPVEDTGYYDLISQLPVKIFITDLAGGTFSFIGNALLILFIYFFLMLGRSKEEEGSQFFSEVAGKISRYVLFKIFLSALTGFIFWLILLSFGVKLALMFGVFAFILNFIPTLGSIIATALPIPIVALQFGFDFKFFLVLSLCTFTQMVIGNFLDPKIIGKDLDLHPIVILLSLIFWGLVWGLGGAFLGVPLTATLKIFLSKIEATKSFSELLAGRFRY